MEIIDRPLNEIIKEQKIGESLRRKGRGGRRAGGGAGGRGGNAPARRPDGRGRGGNAGGRGNGRGGNGRGGNGRGADRQQRGAGGRLRLRLRARRAGRYDAPQFRQDDRAGGRNARRRPAVDFGDDRRERSAKGGPRRRVMDYDRNERTRSSRRNDALSRARFSRD